MAEPISKFVKCAYCHELFPSGSKLGDHIDICHQCHVCGDVYDNIQDRNKHIAKEHLLCENCGIWLSLPTSDAAEDNLHEGGDRRSQLQVSLRLNNIPAHSFPKIQWMWISLSLVTCHKVTIHLFLYILNKCKVDFVKKHLYIFTYTK